MLEGGSQELARLAGIPYTTVRQYIRGETDMPSEKLVALAAAAGVSISWLASGKETAAGGDVPFNAQLAHDLLRMLTQFEHAYFRGERLLPPDQHARAFVQIYEEAIRHPPEQWLGVITTCLQGLFDALSRQ